MFASFGKMRSAFGRIGDLYSRSLTRSPYATNCITGFIVATAGDVLCQKYMEGADTSKEGISNTVEEKPIEIRRALEMGLIRASVVTPFTQFWYGFLTRLSPGTAMVSVLKRVAIDQAIGSPIVIAMVFIAKGVLQLNLESSKDMISQNLVKTWIHGLSYWPIMHTINFRFVPLMYQPMYATFASLYWNAVLSYYSNNVKIQTEETVIDGGYKLVSVE